MTTTVATRFTFRSESSPGVIWETERRPDGWRCACRIGRRPARCWHLGFAETREAQLAHAEEAPMSEPGPTWDPYAPDQNAPIGTCGHRLAHQFDGRWACCVDVLGPGGYLMRCEGEAPASEPKPFTEKPDEYGFVSNCPRCESERCAWELALPLACAACEFEEAEREHRLREEGQG